LGLGIGLAAGVARRVLVGVLIGFHAFGTFCVAHLDSRFSTQKRTAGLTAG
jgi:hypothetical protein